MPPKKRKIKAKDEDPAPAKVSKVDSAAADGKLDSAFQWQMEDKPGCWILFDDETQKTLTSAYNDGDEECEIDNGGFVVMLSKPSRKTKKTGYQKRVRVAKEDKDGQVMTWSWEDGRKKRHYYSVQSVLELENGGDSDSLDVFSEGRPCNVNVQDMIHAKRFTMFREHADAKPAVVSDPPTTSTTAKPPGKSAASKAAADLRTKDSKSKAADEPEEVKEKTVVVKGKAPVDPECPIAGKSHVYYEGNDIWDCMLNQTNLQNNNNKYYLIQLLEDDNSQTYNVWMRWGRVGKKGQTATFPCGPDLDDAKQQFSIKFKDKTKNDWALRRSFSKVPGKYDLLEMDYDTKGDEDVVDTVKKPTKPVKIPESKLDKRLQDLISLIADVRAMEQAVVEMKYDAKKAPLGKLTKAQIKQGYAALQQIEELIKVDDFGFRLTEACNAFYTRIPHDFGMKPPERIVSLDILKQKMNLLEALGDIEIAVKVLQSGDHTMNPIDRNYKSLECDLEPMSKTDDMYKLLESYMLDTHATTHSGYSLELLDIFVCNKELEKSPDIGNKMLLWHGSRLTNWVGILAKGLRIAPPEAPVTGYMFGKGVYFADCSSKSANYCFSTKSKNTGLLMLSEVALGSPNELLAANYQADKLPKGKHSVKGCGKMAPDPSTRQTIDNVVIPCGKLKDTGLTNPAGYSLQYNEYIVYDTKQINMKYLMKVRFNYKY